MKSIQFTAVVCSCLKLLHNGTLQFLGLLICLNGCVEAGRNCENDADFIAFQKQADEFSAISSRTECFELQQAARGILSNAEGCSDKVIIEASASAWLVIDCSKWTGLGE